MKRMGSLNSSGDNADKSATDNDEIFSVNDFNKNIDKYLYFQTEFPSQSSYYLPRRDY